MAKPRKPRLGRGLSSLVSMPEVPVDPPPEAAPEAAPEDAPQGRPEAGGRAEGPRLADRPDPTPRPPEASRQEAGLAAEEGEERAERQGPSEAEAEADPPTGIRWIMIADVTPNPYQPRREFDAEALQELATSIARDGLMQPIVVRPAVAGGGNRYELVAGERRWRAAGMAGLERVPALVRELDDQQLAEWAIIENLQREDLNPIERAQAFARLIEQFNLSHDDVADRVGVGRPTVTNALRLIELPEEVQQMISGGKLSGGAARALLGIPDPEAAVIAARRAAKQGWSVRMIEAEVRRVQRRSGGDQPVDDGGPGLPKRRGRSAAIADLEEQMGSHLQTKVKIRPGRRKGSGTLAIEFYDLDQFEDLVSRLGVTVER